MAGHHVRQEKRWAEVEAEHGATETEFLRAETEALHQALRGIAQVSMLSVCIIFVCVRCVGVEVHSEFMRVQCVRVLVRTCVQVGVCGCYLYMWLGFRRWKTKINVCVCVCVCAQFVFHVTRGYAWVCSVSSFLGLIIP